MYRSDALISRLDKDDPGNSCKDPPLGAPQSLLETIVHPRAEGGVLGGCSNHFQEMIRIFEDAALIAEIRWILNILHDPKYPKPWELWYYTMLRSCRIFRINSPFRQGVTWRVRGRRAPAIPISNTLTTCP